ncbi:MAG: UbiA family prenyltransferase [Spirochaetes bacterium]|nr:UbiA family prenyltransferase [Spirochaetota bacterium]
MSRVINLLRMIKFSHSLFALPFACAAFILYADLSQKWYITLMLVLAAMVSARSAAMAFNRIVDRRIDAANPRTSGREIPRGIVSIPFAAVFTVIMTAIFLLCAYLLNPLAFLLSPIALVMLFGYSYTKRFTPLSHFVLGATLALAPPGVMVAITGSVDIRMIVLFTAVLCWVAGFDIIYSLADVAFDRKNKLHSLPADIGEKGAQAAALVCHAVFIILIFAYGVIMGLGVVYFCASAAITLLLTYGYSTLIRSSYRDIDFFFFNVNAGVSILYFAGVLADKILPAFLQSVR